MVVQLVYVKKANCFAVCVLVTSHEIIYWSRKNREGKVKELSLGYEMDFFEAFEWMETSDLISSKLMD